MGRLEEAIAENSLCRQASRSYADVQTIVTGQQGLYRDLLAGFNTILQITGVQTDQDDSRVETSLPCDVLAYPRDERQVWRAVVTGVMQKPRRSVQEDLPVRVIARFSNPHSRHSYVLEPTDVLQYEGNNYARDYFAEASESSDRTREGLTSILVESDEMLAASQEALRRIGSGLLNPQLNPAFAEGAEARLTGPLWAPPHEPGQLWSA